MSKKPNWIFLLALTLILFLVRLPSFEMPLDPDSGANAFFARYMLRGGILYDTFHTGHHLPGIYYTLELAFRLFGDSAIAPKLFLFPWALACAILIYYMGRSFFDEQTGKLGSIFFILVTSQIWVTGMTVEMEHFANLPLIAQMFLAIVLLRKQAPAWKFIWVGLLGAICVLYKVTFLAPSFVAGLSIILMAWIARKDAGVWKTMLFRLIWMAIGFILPLALVAGYFASLGLWDRFMLVFRFGFNYFGDAKQMGASDLPRPFGFPLFWLSVNNIALLIFGLIASYRLVRRSIRLRNINDLTDVTLVLWLIVSMALAGLRGGGFPHYVLPIVPPLALLGAVEISTAYERWKLKSAEKAANLGRSIFVSLVVVNFLWSNHGIYRDYSMYKLGKTSHDDYIQRVVVDGFANQQISNYVKAHTDRNDFIYIWSIYVEGYYYTDRVPPIDMLWPSYVSTTGSPDRIFDERTRYIILDTPERIDRPQWLLDGLAKNYALETVIEGREIYRRIP